MAVCKADPSGTTLYLGLTKVTLAYTPSAGMGNTGVSADGFDLRKRGATVAWDAGVFDGQHAITQTGFAQVRVETKYSGYRLFGLTTSDIGGGFCPTRYGLELVHGGTLEIYENCVRVAYPPALVYGAGDHLRIEADAGVVRYKRQVAGAGTWQVLYTSTLPVTAALYFNASLYTPGATLKDIRFVIGSTAAPSVNRTYYTFGGARVAMRDGAGAALVYLHGDNLGSASLATSMTGTVLSQQRYKPYGEVRWASGAGMPTDFTFTSQRAGPASYVGSLTDFVARYYSPALGRFVSADTIVQEPSDPQSFNRYAYARNNSLKYVDPSGHCFLLAGLDTAVCVAVWTFVAGGTAVAAVAYELSPSAQAQNRDAALALQTAIDGAEAVYRQSLDTVQGLFVGAIMIGVIESQRGIAALAKRPISRDLTDDEEEHIGRIADAGEFLGKHPDLADEAERERNGEILPPGRGHPGEAREKVAMLKRSVETLENALKARLTDDARRKVQEAIEAARERIGEIQRELNARNGGEGGAP